MTSQGTRNVAVLAAIHTHYRNGTAIGTLREGDKALVVWAPVIVALLLCVVCAIMVGVCMIMREKRIRIQEATSLHNLPWIDALEVFTVSPTEATAGVYLPTPNTPSPPPAYDSVVVLSEKDREAKEQEKCRPPASPYVPEVPQAPPTPSPLAPQNADDLPTYEVAVRMEGNI